MPVPLPTHDFYAHHSPVGAFASFTLGRCFARGGFGLELSGPADQDVYIALARPGAPVQALPFYQGAQSGGAEAYTGQATRANSQTPLSWQAFAPEQMTRTMGWGTDEWKAGDLSFRLLTPFGSFPEPFTLGDTELRRLTCPVLFAEIEIDNSEHETEAFAFFGVSASDPLRPLSDAGASLTGIAREGHWGFAIVSQPGGDAQELLSWGTQEAVARAANGESVPLHRLANRGGILLRVPPGERRTYTLVLGFYRTGIVTSGIATSYLYTRLFPNLEAVLSFGVQNASTYTDTARARDKELDAFPLPDERRFLLAHATRSYYGATMLLHDEKGVLPVGSRATAASTFPHRPLWAVNEGEYRMLNTFDLTVDHAFWEMRFHPWTLRNTLDLFVARYAYYDDVQDATLPNRPLSVGGLSFTHDMGVANQFSPPGYSSYERANLDGCFSYMTQEQLCNWCLCAALYALPTEWGRGDASWLATRRATLVACLESLVNRDGPENERDGVMSLDAARCEVGQEITTYDSLDPSLGQARNNLYLAVKTWASYLALSRCFNLLGDVIHAAEAEEQAARAAMMISSHWNEEAEAFPAVFEPHSSGFTARIIPAIEALAYPYLWNDFDAVAPYGPYGELVTRLRRHLRTVLVPGVCIDETSGGFKLSSSSENTWMSKIFLCQWVAERVLQVPLDTTFDAAHAGWMRDGNSRNFAFTDQVRSQDGYDLGSRYYPRGVTSILWMGRTRQ